MATRKHENKGMEDAGAEYNAGCGMSVQKEKHGDKHANSSRSRRVGFRHVKRARTRSKGIKRSDSSVA